MYMNINSILDKKIMCKYYKTLFTPYLEVKPENAIGTAYVKKTQTPPPQKKNNGKSTEAIIGKWLSIPFCKLAPAVTLTLSSMVLH